MSIDKEIEEKETEICEMRAYLITNRTVDDFRTILCSIWGCDKCKDYCKNSKCEHYNPIKNGIPIQ